MTPGTRFAARQDVQAYAFLAPALILLIALLVYPLAQVVRMSVFEVTVREERWVGLGNYVAPRPERPLLARRSGTRFSSPREAWSATS